jgi:predicted ATP-grasp superfamily ATP-dependent carboligase
VTLAVPQPLAFDKLIQPTVQQMAAGGMQKVLVLDANQRSALAIIRSLGRRGLRIVAADHLPLPIGAASKYAAASLRYSNPATSPAAFTSDLVAAVDRLRIDTIIPATDLTTMLLASQPDLHKSVHLAMPSAASYETVTDKARLLALAERLAVPSPVTREAWTAEAVVDAARDIGFPVVLKPARSKYQKGDKVLSTSVQIVRDRRSLDAALPSLTWLADVPCLVQQFVAGHGAGVFALFGPAGPVAWFAHKRVREKPPGGGVSVLSESIPIDASMQSFAAKLLAAANWTGAAMVEFRVATDGTPYLMEVNGRFWGSLQLAIDCGVDFPWLLYVLTNQLPIPDIQTYAVGRRLRWLLGDLDSMISQLRQSQLSLKEKTRAVGAFAASFMDSRTRQELLRLQDPAPALVESWQWLQALFHRTSTE